eukprot:6352414-Pyramimonas_sp.AAC.1
MEGRSFSKCGVRSSAAYTRLESLQQMQEWRAVGFQNVAHALAPRPLVLNVNGSFMDGGRIVFEM